jgi:hypothetical protein
MMLARTWVPPQSTMAGTNGTLTPGAAMNTMLNVRTVPSVSMSTERNSVPGQEAHALRRSK